MEQMQIIKQNNEYEQLSPDFSKNRIRDIILYGSNLVKKRQNILKSFQSETINKVSYPENISLHDFVQIPGFDQVISKYELGGIGEKICSHKDESFGECYSKAFDQIKDKGLTIPTPYLFLKHVSNVISCFEDNEPLFDAKGEPFSEEEKISIYKEITKEDSYLHKYHYSGGVWLNSYYTLSQIEDKLLEFGENIVLKENNQYLNGAPNGIFAKIGDINFGPLCHEDGKYALCGGTGQGDVFRFYKSDGEYFLDSKCNPLVINYSPRVYGMISSELLDYVSLLSQSEGALKRTNFENDKLEDRINATEFDISKLLLK